MPNSHQIAGLAIITADSVLKGVWGNLVQEIDREFINTRRIWCDTRSRNLADFLYQWSGCETFQKRLKAQVFTIAPILGILVFTHAEKKGTDVSEQLKRLKRSLRSQYSPTLHLSRHLVVRSSILSTLHTSDSCFDAEREAMELDRWATLPPKKFSITCCQEQMPQRSLFPSIFRMIEPFGNFSQSDKLRRCLSAYNKLNCSEACEALDHLRENFSALLPKAMPEINTILDWRSWCPQSASLVEPIINDLEHLDDLDRLVIISSLFETGPPNEEANQTVKSQEVE